MLHTVPLVALETAPVVDIDNTIFLQAILFLGLFVALNYLLFQPWLEIKDKRARKIGGTFDDAAKLRASADAAAAEYEARLARARDDAMSVRSARRREAEAQEAEIVGTARSEAADTIATRKREIAAEVDEARGALVGRVEALADDIAKQILGRSA